MDQTHNKWLMCPATWKYLQVPFPRQRSGVHNNITAELLKADLTTTIDVLHDLFYVIWDNETVPVDSGKGLIIKLAKKGGLTDCGNWTGITLMSVVVKGMGRVLIGRIAACVDAKFRKEQAGFREGTEHDI